MQLRLPALCVALLLGVTSFAQIQAWEKKADFPGDGRSAAVGFSFMDRGFIGTGYDGEDYRRSFYMFDPLTDSWTQTESLGGAIGDGLQRNCAASFTLGNKGYVGTGQSGDPFLNDFWEYNKVTNVWTSKPSVGGIDRRCGVGFAVGGIGYIGLGQDAVGFKKDLWAFDTLTNTWSQKADFIGTPRRLCASFVIGGLAYVGTGDDGGFTKDFYAYNPAVNAWTVKAPFAGSPRYGATGFAVNGVGYITCGYDTTFTNRSDFYAYDPDFDTWTQLDDFPGGARANATAFVVDSLAFLGMGYDTSFYYDIWMWGDTTDPKPIDTSDAIIDLFNGNLSMLIAPNPVQSFTTISIVGEMPLDVLPQVYDASGINVTGRCSITRIPTATENSWRINASELPAGTYYCSVAYDGVHATSKMVMIR